MAIDQLVQGNVDADVDAEIRRLLDAAFHDSHEEADSLQDFCNGDYWFVHRDQGAIVAVTGLIRREVVVGGVPVLVAGIGGVATEESHRNRGYASSLVTAAMDFARAELGLPFGLLQCRPELVGFYQARGWCEINEPILCLQLDAKTYRLPEQPTVMRLAEISWPTGAIDVNGLPW